MNDTVPVPSETHKTTNLGKDPRTRKILVILGLLWLLTLFLLVWVSWNAYFDEKDKSQTLAKQVTVACENGKFSSKDFSKKNQTILCENAEKVIKGEAGPQGLQGLPGPPGADGFNGINGLDGVDGRNGRNGKDGRNGAVGAIGPPGPSGESGKAGATGPPGPVGPPGPAGQDGTDGTDGTDGEDAFPFEFSFTLEEEPPFEDRTFTCRIDNPSSPVVCEEQSA